MDPVFAAWIGDAEMKGPLLTAMDLLPCAVLVLQVPHGMEEQADACEREVNQRWPAVSIERIPLSCRERAACHAFVESLRPGCAAIREAGEGRRPLVAVTKGAPHQLAAWLVLAELGELHAEFVEVDPARVVGGVPCIRRLSSPVEDGTGTHRWQVREPGSVAYETPAKSGRHNGGARLDAALRRFGIHGEHPRWREAVEVAATLAPHNVPVLIQGETGTGKGLLAQMIHYLSDRSEGPFVSVNCGALPEKLIGSVLFGHKRGAFTGADRDQAGKFVMAHGGTLFLDEIGDMPLELQLHLLKVLEDRVVEPLGSPRATKIDVRVVAATNRDVLDAIHKKSFREDLYYRLSYGLIHVPALRERPEDIPGLAVAMLEQINQSLQRPKRLSADGLAWLQAQRWDGNVRDLQNVIGRTALLTRDDLIGSGELAAMGATPLSSHDRQIPVPHDGFSMERFLGEMRGRLIEKALELADGNQSGAARLLGVTPQAVHRYVKEKQRGD